jgi:hypothetical protein
MPSPVVLTMRPRWAAMVGSTNAFDCLQPGQGAFLVGTHQTAVPGHLPPTPLPDAVHAFSGQETPQRLNSAQIIKHIGLVWG